MSFIFFRYILFFIISASISSAAFSMDAFIFLNKNNSTQINSDQLERILKAQQLHWDSGQPIMLIIDQLDSINSDDFLKITKMSKAQFMELWRIKFFSGRAMIPRQVSQPRLGIQLLQDFRDGLYVLIGRKPDEILFADPAIRVIKISY